MQKPSLKKTELPSTVASKNLLSMTYGRNQTTINQSSLRNAHQPMISSFNPVSFRKEKLGQATSDVLEKESKRSNDRGWQNTEEIEGMISRTMQTDAEASIQRNFGSQRYFLGRQRVCSEKVFPLPTQIRAFLTRQSERQSSEDKINLTYGFLAGLNAVYYIVGQQLFIFGIDNLKQRNKHEGRLPQQGEAFKPTKIRPNCRKIHEVNFPVNQRNRIVPNQFQGKVLVLEYPYQIELCSYIIQIEQDPNQPWKKKNKNLVTLVSLDTRIPLDTAIAEFITATSTGQLLYIDEKGLVNCFQFSKTDNNKKLQRKNNQESAWRKQRFISANKGLIKAAKSYFWQILDFKHSLHLSKRKNLAMIYDEKRSRIYTLTIKGDRSTIVQDLRKEIKVYEFVYRPKDVKLDCIWLISEEQLLTQMGISTEKSSHPEIVNIYTAQPDYNQQTSLIVLLSTGIKVYLQISQQNMKISWKLSPPEMQSLQKAKNIRNETIYSISNPLVTKDTNTIVRKWGQKYDIKVSKGCQMKTKALYNDRSVTVGLVRMEKQMKMYMTLRRHMEKSDQYDVFPIELKNVNFFKDADSYPRENEIYQATRYTSQSESSIKFTALQTLESVDNGEKQRFRKPPTPTTLNSHQYLRQVHHGPRFFTYLSNKFISNFTLLRPIDIVFYHVTNREEMFCELYLSSIIGVEPIEICSMLLQIYSTTNGVYFMSQKYMNKIEDIISFMRQNSDKFRTFSTKSLLSISSSEYLIGKQKKNFQEREKQDDQLVCLEASLSEENRSKIRRLFVTFCRLQRIQDPNVFQKVKLKMSSTQIPDKIESLSEQNKTQVQHCMLYISRLVTPFWQAKTLIGPNRESVLKVVEVKVREVLDIVELLKKQSNDFWPHLKTFIIKFLQIIEIFRHIPRLPAGLTLQESLSKQPQFFQPYIFNTIRRQVNPEIIKLYQHKFPLYISDYFFTLIKLFNEIRLTNHVEVIKRLMDRLPEYPDYFVDYLKEEKGIWDPTVWKVKDELKFKPAFVIELPQMPFESLLPWMYEKVKNPSVKMDEKFVYLKEARKRLDSYKSSQNRTEVMEIVSPYTIQRLQKQYIELFKCLKLQQQCKFLIESIIQESIKQEQQSTSSSNIFKSVFSGISQFFSRPFYASNSQDNLTRLSKNSKESLYKGNEQIFNKLNYFAMNRQQLEELINCMENSRASILYMSMFADKSISQKQRTKNAHYFYEKYRSLVKEGRRKYNINESDIELNNKRYEQNFSKLIRFIKSEIKQIFIFLNSVKTPLLLAPLYQGIRDELLKYPIVVASILKRDQRLIYSIARQLVELGYSKPAISDHIVLQNLQKYLRTTQINSPDLIELEINRFVYDWYMVVDMEVTLHKKSNNKDKKQLDILYNVADDFQKMKNNLLNSQKYKNISDFFQKEKSMVYALINTEVKEKK